MDVRALKDGAIAFRASDGSVGVLGRTAVAQWRSASICWITVDPLTFCLLGRED
jgi:hypothetical protein